MQEIRFIDIGCGKGLTLIEARKLGIPDVCGIDYSEELVEICQKNLQAYNMTDIKVFQHDASALQQELDTYNLIYLFNPFGETIMLPFVDNLVNSANRAQRDLYVLYCTPRHKNIFLEHGFDQLDEIPVESPYQANHFHIFTTLYLAKQRPQSTFFLGT